jgi:hypothetical protein
MANFNVLVALLNKEILDVRLLFRRLQSVEEYSPSFKFNLRP